MKKLILLTLIILIALPILVSAQTYKRNTNIDLKVPFEVNGSAASTSATCNITIQYPNSSYVYNGSMQNKNNGNFNITLIGEQTKLLGEYTWTAFCCDTNARCAAGSSSFDVTISGNESINSGQGISLFGSLLVMLFFWVFLFVLSMRVNNPFGKFALLMASFVLFIICIMYALVIVEQTLGNFTSILSGYTTFIFIIRIAAGIGMLALSIFTALVVLRIYKYKRGMLD